MLGSKISECVPVVCLFVFVAPPFSIFLIRRKAELVGSVVISYKVSIFAFCFGLVVILFLFHMRELVEPRGESPPSFCSPGSLWHKYFFTWAALLWVEISSHRELNVKVVLWCGKIYLRQVEKSHKVLWISNLPQGLRGQETVDIIAPRTLKLAL